MWASGLRAPTARGYAVEVLVRDESCVADRLFAFKPDEFVLHSRVANGLNANLKYGL